MYTQRHTNAHKRHMYLRKHAHTLIHTEVVHTYMHKVYTHTRAQDTHRHSHTQGAHTHTVQQHGTQKERFPTKQSGFFFSSTTGSFMCLYEVLMFGQFEQRLGTGRPTVLNKHFPIRVL